MYSQPSFLVPKITPPPTPVFSIVSASHCNEVIQGHVVMVTSVSMTVSRATETSSGQPVRNVLDQINWEGKTYPKSKWHVLPWRIQTTLKRRKPDCHPRLLPPQAFTNVPSPPSLPEDASGGCPSVIKADTLTLQFLRQMHEAGARKQLEFKEHRKNILRKTLRI